MPVACRRESFQNRFPRPRPLCSTSLADGDGDVKLANRPWPASAWPGESTSAGLAPDTCVVVSSSKHRILLPFPTGPSSHVLAGRCPAAYSLLRSAAEFTALGKEDRMARMYRACTRYVHHCLPARGRHSCGTPRLHSYITWAIRCRCSIISRRRTRPHSIPRSPLSRPTPLSPDLNVANKAIPSFSSTDHNKSGVR